MAIAGHQQDAPIPVERHQDSEVSRRRRVVDQKRANRATVRAMRPSACHSGQQASPKETRAMPHKRLAATPGSDQLRAQQDPHHESRKRQQGEAGARLQHRADQNQQACLDGGGHGALGSRKIWSPRPRRQPTSPACQATPRRLRRSVESVARKSVLVRRSRRGQSRAEEASGAAPAPSVGERLRRPERGRALADVDETAPQPGPPELIGAPIGRGATARVLEPGERSLVRRSWRGFRGRRAPAGARRTSLPSCRRPCGPRSRGGKRPGCCSRAARSRRRGERRSARPRP